VPLALRGVKYQAIGATALLRANLLLYGLGGLIMPFVSSSCSTSSCTTCSAREQPRRTGTLIRA
jgi:hypothetical protein